MVECCITKFSRTGTFRPAGKLLQQEGKQLKLAQEVPETEQIIRHLPVRLSSKS